jgi:hypothetical protein
MTIKRQFLESFNKENKMVRILSNTVQREDAACFGSK